MVFATGMDTRTVTTSAPGFPGSEACRPPAPQGLNQKAQNRDNKQILTEHFLQIVSAMIKPMTSMVMGVRHWLKPEIVL